MRWPKRRRWRHAARPAACAATSAPCAWIGGRTRVPWCVPELQRLERLEADLRRRQMFRACPDAQPTTKPGIVSKSGDVIAQPEPERIA